MAGVDGGYASADEDAGPASGGYFRSGAGTSAAAEGSEGAVAGSEGCSGTRTTGAESGAREARAAVVPGGDGPAVSADTSDSTPPAEEGLGRTRCCRLAVLARLLVLEMSTFTRLSEVNRPSSSRA